MSINAEKINLAIDNSLKKIDNVLERFTDTFPTPCTEKGVYGTYENTRGWTTNFWTGELWLAYELAGDEKYKTIALGQMKSFEKRAVEKIGMCDHDIGFTFTLSTVAGYKITGDEHLREVSLIAAKQLLGRFREKGGFIQLAGDETGPRDYYRLIIDCLMNINLLFWASAANGNSDYSNAAKIHFYTTVENALKKDGSSYQNVTFDPDTGVVIKRGTKQGLDENSCWSRGHAWVLYGLPLAYARLKDETILEKYSASLDYFINHLPADFVPYWDLIFDDNSGEPRDSSAAAIAVCGLLEMTKYINDEAARQNLRTVADNIMNSLIDKYTSFDDEAIEGILTHGSYHVKEDIGVDECMIWGDYFFMEALMRYKNPDWKCYWLN